MGAQCRVARLTLLAALLVGPAFAQTTLTGIATVSDGDTLRVGPARVRLHGIDAPEIAQTCQRASAEYRCGVDAANAMKRLTDGKRVSCEIVDSDRYGRLVGRCAVGPVNLSRAMVQLGWAVVYARYLGPVDGPALVEDEARARAAHLGIWQGAFVLPEAWRKEHR